MIILHSFFLKFLFTNFLNIIYLFLVKFMMIILFQEREFVDFFFLKLSIFFNKSSNYY